MDETRHDASRAVIAAVFAGMLIVAVALLLLFVGLRHQAAVDNGTPLPAVVIVSTPTTYGPPPW